MVKVAWKNFLPNFVSAKFVVSTTYKQYTFSGDSLARVFLV